jgi:hypothetical protein
MAWLATKRLKTIYRVLPALVLIGIMTTACTATRTTLWSWKMPGIGEEGTVQNVTKRSTYLDATLKVEEHEYRFLFPGGYRCTQVIKPGATIEYTSFGHIPAVRGSEGDCDPIGILSLKEWVNQHRAQMTPARTKAEVSFKVFYRDDDVAFARGEFEFARPVTFREKRGAGLERPLSIRKRIGVIAVIPNTPECQQPLADGKATAEFQPDAEAPYQLLSGADVCPILGLARTFDPPTRSGGGTKFD